MTFTVTTFILKLVKTCQLKCGKLVDFKYYLCTLEEGFLPCRRVISAWLCLNKLLSHVQIKQRVLEIARQKYHHYHSRPAAKFNILSITPSGKFKCKAATRSLLTPPDPI